MKYLAKPIGSAALSVFGLLIGGGAYGDTISFPNCKVMVEFHTPAQEQLITVEGKENIKLFTATHGPDVQAAWCAPGSAKSAAEMRAIMSFVTDNKKLSDVRTSVVNSPTGWLAFAEAVSTASDGVTPTRFEYQCRAVSPTTHVVCLVAVGRKNSFPRDSADEFFESVRPQQEIEEPTSRNGYSLSPRQVKPKQEKEKTGLNLYEESLARDAKAFGRDQPWGSCIDPLLAKLHDGFDAERQIIGISKLAERRTSLGRVYVLLVKRNSPSTNSVFECELSGEREYIGGRVRRRGGDDSF